VPATSSRRPGVYGAMTDHSLEKVVARARRGDQDAMGVVAQRAAGIGLRTAVVAFADQHLARDVSQEVAIRVPRNLGARRPLSP
jgi:hypothetical protein